MNVDFILEKKNQQNEINHNALKLSNALLINFIYSKGYTIDDVYKTDPQLGILTELCSSNELKILFKNGENNVLQFDDNNINSKKEKYHVVRGGSKKKKDNEESNEDDNLTIVSSSPIPTRVFNYENCLIDCDMIIDEINKNVKKPNTEKLQELQKAFSKVLECVSIKRYREFLENYIKKLEDILKVHHKGKKLKSLLSQSLSGFDQRVIRYNEFHNVYCNEDQLLSLHCNLHRNMPTELLIPPGETFKEFSEPILLTFCSVPEILKSYFCRGITYANFIYLELPKKSVDKYSFYTLKKIDKGQLNWQLDCRAENISLNLTDMLKGNYINTFRTLFLEVFKDNDFRPNFIDIARYCTDEFKQLLRNITFCCKNVGFRTFFQNLIYENNRRAPTKTDKVNMQSDDKNQKKRLETEKDTPEKVVSAFCLCFDNSDICLEEITKLAIMNFNELQQ